MKNYHFAFDCRQVKGYVPALRRMIDNGRSVTYRTLLKHVPVDELARLFPDYEWRPGIKNELRLKDDWAVEFSRSHWRGERCYYVRWSGIEFVFLKRGMNEQ